MSNQLMVSWLLTNFIKLGRDNKIIPKRPIMKMELLVLL